MKVDVKIMADISEPYAIVHTNVLTEEIQRIVSLLSSKETFISVGCDERIVMLRPEEVYMMRIENNILMVYGKDKRHLCRKRLYEMTELLGGNFMQISKSTTVNLSYVDYIEPSFGGMMNLTLKNGLSEYISRKYLPNFKKHFGL